MAGIWLDQDLGLLEEKVNWIGQLLKVKTPATLRERFNQLREESSQHWAGLETDRTCQCTGGKETFTVLRRPTLTEMKQEIDSCLGPIAALIQGTEYVTGEILHKMKQSMFADFNFKKQKTLHNYFWPSNSTEEEWREGVEREKAIVKKNYPDCNMDCILNEWANGKCMVRFALKYQSNILVHKEGLGGCNYIARYNPDYPTIHLNYRTGFSLILPSIFSNEEAEQSSSSSKTHQPSLPNFSSSSSRNPFTTNSTQAAVATQDSSFVPMISTQEPVPNLLVPFTDDWVEDDDSTQQQQQQESLVPKTQTAENVINIFLGKLNSR